MMLREKMGSRYDQPPSTTMGVDPASKCESQWVGINMGG
jgi:hypothetical protein